MFCFSIFLTRVTVDLIKAVSEILKNIKHLPNSGSIRVYHNNYLASEGTPG